MNPVLDKIFKKCYDLELLGLKPSVAVIGGENIPIIKKEMIYMTGSELKLEDSVYRINVCGNMLVVVETKNDFLEVYSNEKI